ncbi:hypothetical protein D3C86_2222010 [compost metagenome]
MPVAMDCVVPSNTVAWAELMEKSAEVSNVLLVAVLVAVLPAATADMELPGATIVELPEFSSENDEP